LVAQAKRFSDSFWELLTWCILEMSVENAWLAIPRMDHANVPMANQNEYRLAAMQ
jgi:hypothetical protein